MLHILCCPVLVCRFELDVPNMLLFNLPGSARIYSPLQPKQCQHRWHQPKHQPSTTPSGKSWSAGSPIGHISQNHRSHTESTYHVDSTTGLNPFRGVGNGLLYMCLSARSAGYKPV